MSQYFFFLCAEHILQCSICMEDFHLDEEVKRLPCDHHYHEECIIRWLELVCCLPHNNCFKEMLLSC